MKYPRTYHLPWSPGATRDDRVLSSAPFEGREVVVTEKMDGENTTIYSGGHYHARSPNSGYHPSRSIVGQVAGMVGHLLPTGWRICGENVYAKHSIAYDDLKAFFLVFGIYDGDNVCLSWDETVDLCKALNLTTVPLLARGEWDMSLVEGFSLDGREGYVVRVADEFCYDDFKTSVAKYVRKGHVQTSDHWMHQAVIPNKLASK